jgi:hypothetical protein
MKKHPLTAKAKALIKKYRGLYKPPDWPVFFQFVPDLDKEHSCCADIHVRDSDNEVLISLDAGVSEDALPRILAHEMAHWLTHDVDMFVNKLLDGNQPLKDYWADILLERLVEGITLSVCPTESKKPLSETWKEKK